MAVSEHRERCVCWWGWVVGALPVPLAGQSARAGKCYDAGDGWRQRALLGNRVVFREEDFDSKVLFITWK